MPRYVDKEFGNHSHNKRVLQSARDFRRAQIYKLYMVERRREIDIAKTLSISQSTVSAEVNAIKQDSINELKAFLSQHLPIAFSVSIAGVDSIISTIHTMLSGTTNQELRMADRTNLLSLLAHCYDMRLEMYGNSEMIVEAMEQMALVKQQLAGMLPAEQVALMEDRIAGYQTGGIVTAEGEVRQERVLREQRMQQQQSNAPEDTANDSLNNNADIESNEEENLNDESSGKELSSAAAEISSSFIHSTHLSSQQNDECLSRSDSSSSSSNPTTSNDFKHGGNGHDTKSNTDNTSTPARPTRNKVF